MALSEKQKECIRAWDRENMKSISCRVRANEAKNFKDYCTAHGTTPGKMLKEYVFECIHKYSMELEEQEKEKKKNG